MPTQLHADFFRRVDDDDDEVFYSVPRLVTHIDDGAITKVGEIYAQLLPQGGAILDLMSSWRSHLPADIKPVARGRARDESRRRWKIIPRSPKS